MIIPLCLLFCLWAAFATAMKRSGSYHDVFLLEAAKTKTLVLKKDVSIKPQDHIYGPFFVQERNQLTFKGFCPPAARGQVIKELIQKKKLQDLSFGLEATYNRLQHDEPTAVPKNLAPSNADIATLLVRWMENNKEDFLIEDQKFPQSILQQRLGPSPGGAKEEKQKYEAFQDFETRLKEKSIGGIMSKEVVLWEFYYENKGYDLVMRGLQGAFVGALESMLLPLDTPSISPHSFGALWRQQIQERLKATPAPMPLNSVAQIQLFELYVLQMKSLYKALLPATQDLIKSLSSGTIFEKGWYGFFYDELKKLSRPHCADAGPPQSA